MRKRNSRIRRGLLLVAGISILATGCPGDPGAYRYGGAGILTSQTTSETIEYWVSQTSGQPDVQVKIIEVVNIPLAGENRITNWGKVATGNGPAIFAGMNDTHWLIGATSWELYTCIVSDPNDCHHWQTWTAS